MRRSHFETLRPICPRCRHDGSADSPLVLTVVAREDGEHVVEGILECPAETCRLEYPVIDGVPILVPDVADYVQRNAEHLDARDDLSDPVRRLIAEGAGAGSSRDVTRQHLSIYGWDHYADLDPGEPDRGDGEPAPGAVVRTIDRLLDEPGARSNAPALDVGCAVGRGTLEVAARCDGLVLGVDLHFAMLRMAAGVLRAATVRYPRRRVGLVYDERTFPAACPGAARVDFWACDALALPFAAGAAGLVTGLNLLDCVASPVGLLQAIARVLRPGGRAILTTPYDWSPNATPPAAWIGGHSPRSAHGGASEPLLRDLLTPGAHPQSIAGLRLLAERDDLSWHTRLHERAVMLYRMHAVTVERTDHA